VEKLMSIPMWNTHPDFKEGFDVYEVSLDSQTKYWRDEKLENGFYVERNLRWVKLIKTIKNKNK